MTAVAAKNSPESSPKNPNKVATYSTVILIIFVLLGVFFWSLASRQKTEQNIEIEKTQSQQSQDEQESLREEMNKNPKDFVVWLGGRIQRAKDLTPQEKAAWYVEQHEIYKIHYRPQKAAIWGDFLQVGNSFYRITTIDAFYDKSVYSDSPITYIELNDKERTRISISCSAESIASIMRDASR